MGPRKPPEAILKCSGLILDFGCGHYKLQSERAKVIGLDYVLAQGADVLADFELSLRRPLQIWRLIGHVIANRVPLLYETMLYISWPAYEIIFELRVVK